VGPFPSLRSGREQLSSLAHPLRNFFGDGVRRVDRINGRVGLYLVSVLGFQSDEKTAMYSSIAASSGS
jgi:hypothetical protein